MEKLPEDERMVIGADLNGHVGKSNKVDEEARGKHGITERNLEGQKIIDFAKKMKLGYFQKKEEQRVTYKSGGGHTQVDYILVKRRNLKEIIDC